MARCNACNSEFHIFRWKYSCAHCGELHCSDCLWGVKSFAELSVDPFANKKYCDKCHSKVISPTYNKYKKAVEDSALVRLFPKTYLGKVRFDESIMRKKFVTCWVYNYDDDDDFLKVDAAYQGFNGVVDIHSEKETRRRGNYKYSVYRKVGYGVILK
jgi:hypothetical protein